MKKTTVVILALLLIGSLLPAAMADERLDRIKSISTAGSSSAVPVLTNPAKVGKLSAERARYTAFKKVQKDLANAVPGAVVAEKAKIGEITAPVGSQERRTQMLDRKIQLIEAAKARRFSARSTP